MQKKSFWQNSIPVYDKNSPESGHRRNLTQYDNGHIGQTHSKYYSQWWKTESISSGIRNKTRMSNLTTIIQRSFQSPRHVNQRRKRKKMIEIEKEAKLSLITDDMILCIENPKYAMRKLLILDLNNEFGKSAGYEINRQKSLAFLYTKIKILEREIKEIISCSNNNPIKKCIEDLYRHYSKEDIQMAKKYTKRCSVSLNIRDIQIKTLMRYHCTLVTVAMIK